MTHLQRFPNAHWAGVVMIIRPDFSKLPLGSQRMCVVCSKRDLALDGKRAIYFQIPYAAVRQWFKSDDGDAVEVYAELIPGPKDFHLEFIERATKRDFFLVSPTPVAEVIQRPVPAH